jgi:predicted ATPase/class 3 adenylate cyclase
MSAPPGGTVTFLFTDIEGSTRLLQARPERYGELLAEHRRLLRHAFAANGGREVGAAGDGFFVAFRRARDAVGAAVEAQRSLTSHRWPDGIAPRVRMGLHTGEATWADESYVGLGVHRAARICDAGHGGQILLSNATRELLADDVSSEIGLADLGEHRLKDLDRPERLHQVVAADLPTDFPPVRATAPASDAPRSGSRLPVLPTETIGREAELSRLHGLLTQAQVRLVTIAGPGGVGKTRLAIEAARSLEARFADGAHFVALASVATADDVPATVARALGLVPSGGQRVEDAVARHLSGREMLLVLDNFEHLLQAASWLSDVLASSPRVRALVTSREPLRLRGEHVLSTTPLALPLGDQPAETAPAVALFLALGRARLPDFAGTRDDIAAAVEVCRRVDGLPLGIELAAGRLGLLSPAELAGRLAADGLDALGASNRDLPARQRTLRATLDWSHRLLNRAEQAAFARLAVCVGASTLEAAERISDAPLETLESLVDKHLVVAERERDGSSRLRMLETIRRFALDRLAEESDAGAAHRRHSEYYTALAEALGREFRRSGAPRYAEQIDADLDNIRAALDRALGGRDAETVIRTAEALRDYWLARGLFTEAVRWLDHALALEDDTWPLRHQAAAQLLLSRMLARGPTAERAESAARRCLDWYRELGHSAGAADALATLALSLIWLQRPTEAHECASEAASLARATGEPVVLAEALEHMALSASTLGDALRLGEQAVRQWRTVGNPRRVTGVQSSLSYAALCFGGDDSAAALVTQALHNATETGDRRALAYVRGNQGLVALFAGDVEQAAEAFTDELRLSVELAVDSLIFEAIVGIAAVHALRGQEQRAAEFAGAAARLSPERHDPRVAERLNRRCFDAARARLGNDRWQAAEDAGGRLTLEQVHALIGDKSPVPRETHPSPGKSAASGRAGLAAALDEERQ